MNTRKVYIVQYNDCYGNGTDKKLEAIIESKDDFISWLEEHNSNREEDEQESKEEFTLIPIDMFDFNSDRFICNCCGDLFPVEEMDMEVDDDQDLCKNCNYQSYNDAPYGQD